MFAAVADIKLEFEDEADLYAKTESLAVCLKSYRTDFKEVSLVEISLNAVFKESYFDLREFSGATKVFL